VRRAIAVVAALAIAVTLVTVALAQRVGAPVRGTPGDDRLIGTPASNDLRGLAGDDVLDGRGGADFLTGNSGRVVVRGGAGPDTILAGPGRDSVRGGPGHDRITVGGDGVRDVAACGPGNDEVTADARDMVAADCERVRRSLPLGTAPTPVTVEFLGWTSSPRSREPGPVTAVPDGAAPSGGSLTACAAGDVRLNAFYRLRGLARRTSSRVVLDFPSGRDFVDLDSYRPRENGALWYYAFLRSNREGRAEPLLNGAYAIRFQVEAGGVYTTVAEATVTRACA
jgi:hypothetical protein